MKFPYLLFAATLLALGGCGSNADLKEKLGLNREGPDEYRVVPRPPLSMPPDFSLRPPGQDSNYLSGMPADQRAHSAVLGTDNNAPMPGFTAPAAGSVHMLAGTAVTPVASSDLPTGDDAQFLSNAGASKVDPNIRQKLLNDKMNGLSAKDSNYLFSGKSKDEPVVDPTKEQERLNQDKSQNLPPTAGGDTPVVATPNKGLLGGIF